MWTVRRKGDVKFQVVSMVGCVGANQEVAPSYMRLTCNKTWRYYSTVFHSREHSVGKAHVTFLFGLS